METNKQKNNQVKTGLLSQPTLDAEFRNANSLKSRFQKRRAFLADLLSRSLEASVCFALP